jgi:hypothetical protein
MNSCSLVSSGFRILFSLQFGCGLSINRVVAGRNDEVHLEGFGPVGPIRGIVL